MPDYFPFRSAKDGAGYLAWSDQQIQKWLVAQETRLQHVALRICAETVPEVGHDMTAIQVAETTRRILAFLSEL